MALFWFIHGFILVYSWLYSGLFMALFWFIHGFILVYSN